MNHHVSPRLAECQSAKPFQKRLQTMRAINKREKEAKGPGPQIPIMLVTSIWRNYNTRLTIAFDCLSNRSGSEIHDTCARNCMFSNRNVYLPFPSVRATRAQYPWLQITIRVFWRVPRRFAKALGSLKLFISHSFSFLKRTQNCYPCFARGI